MRKLLKKYGFVPDKLVTDDLRSYAAAASELSLARRHERGQWRNNRAEELASTDPTTRIQDAAFQMSGVSSKVISQLTQPPTTLSTSNAISFLQRDTEPLCGGYEHVARGSQWSFENIRDAEFSCSSFNNVIDAFLT